MAPQDGEGSQYTVTKNCSCGGTFWLIQGPGYKMLRCRDCGSSIAYDGLMAELAKVIANLTAALETSRGRSLGRRLKGRSRPSWLTILRGGKDSGSHL